MFTIMRYDLNKGRSSAEEYDTFDCSRAQADDVVRALRGTEGHYFYWAVPAQIKTEPTTVTNLDEVRASEISSAVSALLVS